MPSAIIYIRYLSIVLIIGSFLSLTNLIRAQELPHDGRYFERQAMTAYRAKDNAGFLSNLQAALRLRPNHPRILYNLSVAYVLSGKPAEAIQSLGKVAAMGLDYPADQDDDLTTLKDSPDFKQVLAKFAENRKPVGSGTAAFTLKEKGLIAEGLAYDPNSKSYFVSSVHQRKIIRVDAKGVASDFSTPADGLWSVLGMKVDASRQKLWVCTSAMPQMEGFDATKDKNQAALLEYDLRGKNPVKRHLLTDRIKPHVFGDLVIAKNGDVYVSDSGAPAIYLLRRGAHELETFVTNDQFVNLQGLAFAPGEKRMYVADYANGVFAIDLATKKVTLLATPPDATLLGLDGIYLVNNSLIAIQNGVSPQRIVRLTIDGDQIAKFGVLEANQPAHDDITLGTVVGKDLFYIANGQWNLIGDDGKFAEPSKLKDVVILRLPLTVH
ncbi:MAG: hypothetical protein ABIP75_09605 [Pyrinomonadaceae bacterium]